MFKKRLIQYSLFWLYTVLSLIIPCYLMIEKYGIFKEPNAKKLTFCAIFVIILCFFSNPKSQGILPKDFLFTHLPPGLWEVRNPRSRHLKEGNGKEQIFLHSIPQEQGLYLLCVLYVGTKCHS